MILPPFFGIASKYDEPSVRKAIITYLNADLSTYDTASSVANITFLTTDSATFKTPLAIASLTYLSLDAVTNRSLSTMAHVTYGTADICTYDPPPQAPEITVFITGLVEDSTIELTWNTPYNNRCPITHYVLEYSNCFLTNLQTENNYTLVTEITDPLIEEYFRDNCEYQEFDKSRLLSQDLYRITSNNNYLIITEQSTGVGLSNFAIIDELSNGQSYLFRVAAVNCVGTGEFGYSGILTPLGPEHQYCDVLAFMQPDSTTDIYASLTEHSCREKTINHLAGVTVSSQSKFGPGSLYFDGVYESSPTPPTYSHLQIDHNYNSSLDTWSLIDDFTIELWVKPNTSPVYTNQTLVSCYYQNNYNTYENYQNRYWKLYTYGNTIKFNAYMENYDYQTGEFDSGYIDLTANISLPITKFTHIAVCRFNNYIRLFVDGIKYDRKYFNKNIIIPYDNNPYVIIGASQTDSYVYSDEFQTGRGTVNEPYIGYIDDLMLSKAARYGKNFIPQKYTEPPDCQDCGGYVLAASLTTIENDFIP